MGPSDPFADRASDDPQVQTGASPPETPTSKRWVTLAPAIGAAVGIAAAIFILLFGPFATALVIVLGGIGACGGWFVARSGPQLRQKLEALVQPSDDP